MKITLIICLLNESKYIDRLFDSILLQNYKKIEVIIVDQSYEKIYKDYFSKYNSKLELKYITSEKGLSKSRNKGLKFATGDIVCFPDDDCFYEQNVFKKVIDFFENIKNEVLSIKMTNCIKSGRKIQEKTKDCELNYFNIFNLWASISIFIRKEVLEKIGNFDENLGLGSNTIIQSYEDIDLGLRCLENKISIKYIRDIIVYHPWDDIQFDKEKKLIKRAYGGGFGEMYVLNKYNYSNLFKVKVMIRRIMISIYYFCRIDFYKMRMSFLILKGNIDGYKNIKL